MGGLSDSHMLLSHSIMSNSVTLRTVAHQAPLPMGFSRQECWSGLPCPSPGDLPSPGIEPGSSHMTGRFFTIWATREALSEIWTHFKAIVLSSIKCHKSSFYNNKHNSYNFTTRFFSAFHIDTQSIIDGKRIAFQAALTNQVI